MTYKVSLIAQVTGASLERFELSKSEDGEATLRHFGLDTTLVSEMTLPLEALRALIHQMPVVFPEPTQSALNQLADAAGMDRPAAAVSQRRRRRADPQEAPSVATQPAAATQAALQQRAEEGDECSVRNIDRRTGEVIE